MYLLRDLAALERRTTRASTSCRAIEPWNALGWEAMGGRESEMHTLVHQMKSEKRVRWLARGTGSIGQPLCNEAHKQQYTH
jgi:hypothetical protein